MTAPIVSAHRGRGHPARARVSCVVVLAALAALLPGGCKALHLPKIDLTAAPVTGPGSTARNHVDSGAIPTAVRRVAVLPMHAEGWRAGELGPLDDALRGELAQIERFELTFVSRGELASRFGRETFSSTAALPQDFLARLHADLGVDAVLLLDLTHYAPYQPLALGVRAKLVTTGEGAALWAFDSVFDSARPDISAAARSFANDRRRPGPAFEDSTGILQSPSRFAKYVGHVMFETLPPRRTE